MTAAPSVLTPGGLLSHLASHPVPAEEVRFAVVLNGGVSLAVWMGGVVLELDRLTKADPSAAGPYALLKRLTGCTARADVITGTSAGGINGAALALTQVNRQKDPAMLRDLWIDQGRIESLLRQPFRGQPTSLLRGDEYFLPRLHAALEMLSASATDPPGTCASPREAPIDLSITTTVLRGNEAVSVDSTGQQLPQSLHAARFHWERRPDTTEEADPFAQHHQRRTAHRLALAARSSASFPVAFEPSFVPVGSPDHREPGPGEALTAETTLRPDMADLVRGWGTARTGDRSRFCVDGGVLASLVDHAVGAALEHSWRAMRCGGSVVCRQVLFVDADAAIGEHIIDECPLGWPQGKISFIGEAEVGESHGVSRQPDGKARRERPVQLRLGRGNPGLGLDRRRPKDHVGHERRGHNPQCADKVSRQLRRRAIGVFPGRQRICIFRHVVPSEMARSDNPTTGDKNARRPATISRAQSSSSASLSRKHERTKTRHFKSPLAAEVSEIRERPDYADRKRPTACTCPSVSSVLSVANLHLCDPSDSWF